MVNNDVKVNWKNRIERHTGINIDQVHGHGKKVLRTEFIKDKNRWNVRLLKS